MRRPFYKAGLGNMDRRMSAIAVLEEGIAYEQYRYLLTSIIQMFNVWQGKTVEPRANRVVGP